jgi:hypothetical protein
VINFGHGNPHNSSWAASKIFPKSDPAGIRFAVRAQERGREKLNDSKKDKMDMDYLGLMVGGISPPMFS